MSVIAAACAGFLIAVLWMDLIFDSQVLRHRGVEELPEEVLASVAAYYRRATTTSRPMGHVIAVVMLALLGAVAFAWMRGDEPVWLLGVLTALAGVPVLLAGARTVPNAARLGARSDDVVEQSRLARAVCRDHLVCLAFMSAFLVTALAT